MKASNPSAAPDPWSTWFTFAATTGEMMTASAFVIGKRVTRLCTAGAMPSKRDQREFTLMGQEKLEAAASSMHAMARKLLTATSQQALHASRQWITASTAMTALAASRTPRQALEYQMEAASAIGEMAQSGTHLVDAAASVAQAGLEPIHAKATANAKRLGTS